MQVLRSWKLWGQECVNIIKERYFVIVEMSSNFYRDDIMSFINSILHRVELPPQKGSDLSPITSLVSTHLFISLFLMYSNPAPHALIIAETPCAPQFISSLILGCDTPGTKVPYLHTVPFFFLENYVVTLVLFELSFSWGVVFLGLGWAYGELIQIR